MRVERVESVGHCCEHLHLPETTCGNKDDEKNLRRYILESLRGAGDFQKFEVLLARVRLGSSSRIRWSCESRKSRKLMP